MWGRSPCIASIRSPPSSCATRSISPPARPRLVTDPYEWGGPTWELRVGRQVDVRPVHGQAQRDASAGPMHPGDGRRLHREVRHQSRRGLRPHPATHPPFLTDLAHPAGVRPHPPTSGRRRPDRLSRRGRLGAGLGQADALAAHARLPRPLRQQVPPLLRHPRAPPRRTPHLAPAAILPTAGPSWRKPTWDEKTLVITGSWQFVGPRLAHHRRRRPRRLRRRPRPRTARSSSRYGVTVDGGRLMGLDGGPPNPPTSASRSLEPR